MWIRCTVVYCSTINRYPIFSTRYSVTCKIYTGYHGASEIEHGLCAKARGLSLRIDAQTMLYLSLTIIIIIIIIIIIYLTMIPFSIFLLLL